MRYVFSFFFLLSSFLVFSQQGDGGVPYTMRDTRKNNITIPTEYFGSPNIQKLRKEDHINDSLHIGPWRFGYNYNTSLNFFDNGTWITTKDGGKIWLLKIEGKYAKTLNLTFSNTKIPEGNELYIYNPKKTFILGKFTQHHLYKGELGAELVPGNTIIVEYDVPASNVNNLGYVEISRVTYGYRTRQEFIQKAFGSSQSCEMNVNCPDGQPYIKQRNSAVMLVVGSNGFCSGALINNTNYNGTPYVLTANHCTNTHHNYASWIFRFKWQAPTCANPQNPPSFESVSGAVLRAKRSPSDFCLVEITGGLQNGTVPEDCDPYFAGWNLSNTPPPSTFCIHHPLGDIAKISFDDDPPVITQGMGSPEPKSTWKVIWDRNTATESASSGSPLFNNHGQIIGQLWGGNSSCANSGAGGHDYYGRISKSWNPTGSTNSQQLKHWLDPNNTSQTSITGYDPYVTPKDYNVALNFISGTDGEACDSLFHPFIQFQNRGNKTLTSLTVNYTYNNLSTKSLQWNGNLITYQSDSVQLPPISNITGLNHITVELTQPNNHQDAIPANNKKTRSYHAAPNGTRLHFRFNMGCFPDENAWVLKNSNGKTLYSGGNYHNGGDVNHYIEDTFCLEDGCYDLVLQDSYGDGVFGSTYGGCSYDGSMTLIRIDNGDTIAYLPEEEAKFGYTKTFHFCVKKVDLLEKYKDVDGAKIYPNPNNGTFTVISPQKGQKHVILYTTNGKKVIDFKTSLIQFKIKKKQLASGIYILSITSSEGVTNKKIIIN